MEAVTSDRSGRSRIHRKDSEEISTSILLPMLSNNSYMVRISNLVCAGSVCETFKTIVKRRGLWGRAQLFWQLEFEIGGGKSCKHLGVG